MIAIAFGVFFGLVLFTAVLFLPLTIRLLGWMLWRLCGGRDG